MLQQQVMQHLDILRYMPQPQDRSSTTTISAALGMLG